MENLFVTDDPHQGIRMEIVVFEHCRADVLRNVDAGAVFAEQDFCAELAEIGNHCAVFPPCEDSLFQPLLYGILAEQVGFAFQIGFLELNAHASVGFVESGDDP